MSADLQPTHPLPDLHYIRELAKIIKQHDLDEIEIEAGEQRLLLRRNEQNEQTVTKPAAVKGQATSAVSQPVVGSSLAGLATSAASDQSDPAQSDFITSPFVGTFFAAPRPESVPFVRVGQQVVKGQPLCLIEAMKLFNEIEADFPCVIEAILAKNEQSVDYGTQLFRVRRL